MSATKQVNRIQQSVEDYQPNLAIALQIASIMTEANQRLFKIQSEAANAAFAENSAHLMTLSEHTGFRCDAVGMDPSLSNEHAPGV